MVVILWSCGMQAKCSSVILGKRVWIVAKLVIEDIHLDSNVLYCNIYEYNCDGQETYFTVGCSLFTKQNLNSRSIHSKWAFSNQPTRTLLFVSNKKRSLSTYGEARIKLFMTQKQQLNFSSIQNSEV